MMVDLKLTVETKLTSLYISRILSLKIQLMKQSRLEDISDCTRGALPA